MLKLGGGGNSSQNGVILQENGINNAEKLPNEIGGVEARFLVREATPRPLDVEPQTSLREVESTASQTCPQGEKNKIAEDTAYTQDGSGGASDGFDEPDHRRADSDTICSSREREREVAHSSTMVQQMAQPRIIPQWEIEWNQYGKLQKSWWKKYNGAVNLEIWIRNQG